MLSVNAYQNSKELFEFKFIEKSSLPIEVICPGPIYADHFRSKLSSELENEINIITISKFVSDQLSLSGVEELEQHTMSKFDMMLNLATVWKSSFPGRPYETFFQAFDLFTELRSFTLYFDLVSEVLAEFDAVIGKAVGVFWQISDQLGFIDEHKGYLKLTEAYRSNDNPVNSEASYEGRKKNIVFWGFKHMSAIQLDLLKALAIRHDVYVPISENILRQAQSSDWVSWISTDDDLKEHKVEKVGNCRLVRFSKNRLGETIKQFMNGKNDDVDVFLASTNITSGQIHEISLDNMFFKAPADLFSLDIRQEVEQIREKFFEDSLSDCNTDLIIDDVKDSIQQLLNDAENEINYKKIKSLSLLLRTLIEWESLSDINKKFTVFDLRIVEDGSILKVPRIFSVPILTESRGNILGVDALQNFDPDKLSIVCASSQYGPMLNRSSKFSEKIINFLLTIGPVKRAEFDFLQIKEMLAGILSNSNSFLFLENGLEDHDLSWSEILDSFEECEVIKSSEEKGINSINNYLMERVDSKRQGNQNISASSLQTYLDCPQKYYLSYVERLNASPSPEGLLQTFQLGILEHLVIQKYCEANSSWNENQHSDLTQKIVSQFLLNEGITVKEYQLDSLLVEVRDYSKNGIRTILSLKELDPETKYSFEREIKIENRVGSIDCIATGSWGVGLFDFKRTEGSIPSDKAVTNFEKIQLWFYLKSLPEYSDKLAIYGYLNLSSPKDSLIYIRDEMVQDQISGLPFIKQKYAKVIRYDFLDKLKEYSVFEKQLEDKIFQDHEFPCSPKKKQTCTFCLARNICQRSSGEMR